MSQETATWLNTQTLIGFTEKRGHAWHYRAEEQGDESNHYEGPVPIGDVERRLFNWEAIDLPVYVQIPATVDDATGMTDDGQPVRMALLDDRKAIARSDTHDVLGMFKSGYQAHQYREWLMESVGSLLGSELGIASAGLLKGGAVAWVQVEVPETVDTAAGFSFRPFLTAATSLDGSLATTYKRGATAVVCDNTLEVGLMGTALRIKIRHTRNSGLKLESAREALMIVEQTAEAFADTIEGLTEWTLTTREFDLFLDAVCPVPEGATVRTTNMAEAKRASLEGLYLFDERVAPWNGTALGVLQATNTYMHHVQGARGSNRADRNAMNALTGATAKADLATLAALHAIAPAPTLVAKGLALV